MGTASYLKITGCISFVKQRMESAFEINHLTFLLMCIYNIYVV